MNSFGNKIATIMDFAINTNTILAIRVDVEESSEMTSQLLFGEYCAILEENEAFCKIENCIDKHIGWVKKDGLHPLSSQEIEEIKKQPTIRVCVPMADVFCLTDKTIYRFTIGSLIPNYDANTSKFELAGKIYQIHPSFITYLPESNKEGIVPTAMSLLNTPYLCGGKNIFGMDCSGFVQTVFSVNGYILPRFARQQSNEGIIIENISDAEAGDLLFFEKDSKIFRAGIYMGGYKAIHVANNARIDNIDQNGTYEVPGIYTYKLSKIKRLA